jgi:Ferric reductase NAD binding domain
MLFTVSVASSLLRCCVNRDLLDTLVLTQNYNKSQHTDLFILSKLLITNTQGRPNWSEFFKENTAVGTSLSTSTTATLHRVSVLVCGPDVLMKGVGTAATKANSAHVKYHVHKESFE